MPRYHSFESKIQKTRTLVERFSDGINNTVGSFPFFIINLLIFTAWFAINTGQIPNIPPFDPYPFNFLTMTVSLEAIFLSIFVLMSQNRQASIDSLRDEIHLQIDLIAEKEITKALKLIAEIHQKTVGETESDKQLQQMLQAINTNQIESNLEKELIPPPMLISDFLKNPLRKLGLIK